MLIHKYMPIQEESSLLLSPTKFLEGYRNTFHIILSRMGKLFVIYSSQRLTVSLSQADLTFTCSMESLKYTFQKVDK